MTEPAITRKRLLVAFDANQDYQTILDIAALLAMHQQAELSALFVEDINLFHLAGLPFIYEIDRISSIEKPLDALKIARDLEKQLLQIRHLLADFKKRASVEISLTVVRGHYISEALAAAADADLLLLDRRRIRQKTTLKPASGKAFIRPVWVIYDGSEASERCLLITGELLKSQRAELNIVINAESKEKAAELETQARQLTAEFHANKHYFIVENNNFSSIIQCMAQRGCSILVMNTNREDKALSDQQAAVISEKAECPVLLVA